MAKVEIIEKPSQKIIKEANKEFLVTDINGRKLKIKKPNALSQLRLVKAVGDSAKNEIWLGMVMPILYVKEIDGNEIIPPITEREVEALYERLDDDGIVAVIEGIKAHFGIASNDLNEVKDSIKK